MQDGVPGNYQKIPNLLGDVRTLRSGEKTRKKRRKKLRHKIFTSLNVLLKSSEVVDRIFFNKCLLVLDIFFSIFSPHFQSGRRLLANLTEVKLILIFFLWPI